jgi:hypothetical protein
MEERSARERPLKRSSCIMGEDRFPHFATPWMSASQFLSYPLVFVVQLEYAVGCAAEEDSGY